MRLAIHEAVRLRPFTLANILIMDGETLTLSGETLTFGA